MRLYEITEQFKSLEALEVSEDIPAEVLLDTLEGLQGELQEKATNVALFSRNLESVALSIEAAAAKMLARAEVLRKRAASLDAYLLLNLQACGITKVTSPWLTISVKKNPPAVVIDHADSIPEKFWRQPETPPKVIDRKAIAAAIKAGEEVPGCHTSTGERLEIKA
jgi:hypothetical protein